ncbi:hypothetical protein AGMMS4952_08370 [Spirochaetia bacterium]|nr:hypothetical protein AGMMS4952_08370 [Spirochaetia bacterium]
MVLQKRHPGGIRRLPLIAMMAFLLPTAIFAESYVFTNLDHYCTGEHCPICLQIEIAKNLLEGLGRIGIIALITGFFAHAGKHIKKVPFSYLFSASPVLLKVKSTT